MISTIRRIRWRNITGLLVFVIIAFAVVYLVSAIDAAFKGDCIEKDYLKACFSIDKSSIPKHEISTITIDVTNKGKIDANATVVIAASSNLEIVSTASQSGVLAPGDTMRKTFRVAAKDEVGTFKIDIDLNNDGGSDKKLLIRVE